MNKLCVPRGTIGVFGFGKYGGGGSDCREVKYSGKEPPPTGNLKFRKACGKAEKFRTELNYEQVVCSTWNNRSFRLREVWGRRLGLRRSKVLRKRAAAPEKP